MNETEERAAEPKGEWTPPPPEWSIELGGEPGLYDDLAKRLGLNYSSNQMGRGYTEIFCQSAEEVTATLDLLRQEPIAVGNVRNVAVKNRGLSTRFKPGFYEQDGIELSVVGSPLTGCGLFSLSKPPAVDRLEELNSSLRQDSLDPGTWRFIAPPRPIRRVCG